MYDAGQIVDAQVIRHLRSLEVPVNTIREILVAPAVSTRNELIAAHLARLEVQLEATRAAVSSLRGLLVGPPAQLDVEHRHIPVTAALVIRQTIDLADLSDWFTAARDELDASTWVSGMNPFGPLGGIWDTDLFLNERGEAALYIPIESIDGIKTPAGRVRAELLPAVDVAVAVHRGPDETMAHTYGALGAYVAEHEIGVDSPIRETYLQEPTPGASDVVTEVGWPIFRTTR